MLNKFLVVLIVILASSEGKTQYTLERVIAKSEEYYTRKDNGSFKVTYTFKSSIAESYHTTSSDISFCKRKGISKIASEKIEIILTPNKYYYIDPAGRRFIDLSEEKSFKKEKKEGLEQYPHFNPNYFDRIKKNQFKIELSGTQFHVYDLWEHFYIDTLDYCILRYKSFFLDATGLQIKEWNIENQEFYDECPDESSDFSFIKKYKQVKSFRTTEENPDYKGAIFWKLIPVPYLYILGPDSISINSLSGKYILIDFFYQSCMPCIMSFKYLKELNLINNPEKELVIIGVDPVPYDSSSMGKFIKRYQLKYPVIIGSFANKLNSIFNPIGYPYYVLINPKGEIIETQEGFSEEFFKKVKGMVSK